MACANGVKPLKKKKTKEGVTETFKQEEKTMNGTMVDK